MHREGVKVGENGIGQSEMKKEGGLSYHSIGFVLDAFSGAHSRVEEAGGHDVYAGKVAPFAGEGFAEVGDVGFGCVVDL